MTDISPVDLAPSNDPDELLSVLYRVPRDPVPALQTALRSLCSHPDPDIREEAIRILGTRWKEQTARPLIIGALESDREPNVRSAAAFALTATSSGLTRDADTAALRSIVCDDSEDLEARAAAYDALRILHLHKLRGSTVWPIPTKRREFNPAVDVDWAWMNSL